jgi:hypothetical protein
MDKHNGFMVYWAEHDGIEFNPNMWFFNQYEMSAALSYMEELRKQDHIQFVTMVAKSSDLVGPQGANIAQSGVLPNGDEYVYTKRDALSQRTK